MNLGSVLKATPGGAGITPTVPGTPYAGGFYAGRITIGGVAYALIVAPKALGEASLIYRTSGAAFTGNTSTNDGWLIRNNMIAEGIEDFPAQRACMALAIGGFRDWYIGAKDEMEVIYRNLKPSTTNNVTTSGINSSAIPPTASNYTTGNPARTNDPAFRSAAGAQFFILDYYFTATQGPSGPTYVHGKRFTTGGDGEDLSLYDYNVRAIRKTPVVTA